MEIERQFLVVELPPMPTEYESLRQNFMYMTGIWQDSAMPRSNFPLRRKRQDREEMYCMKRGAIFDMDGLMFDTEAVWQDSWRKIAASRGIELPDAFTLAISGSSGQGMREVIKKYYSVSTDEEADVIVAECVQKNREALASFVPEKTGLREILQMFRDHDVRMAVASSSPKDIILANLNTSGTEKYFSAIVSGTEVRAGKPAPDIFLWAAEKLGLSAADTYIFEDSFNGIRAAHAAGGTPVMVPDLIEPTDEIRALCA